MPQRVSRNEGADEFKNHRCSHGDRNAENDLSRLAQFLAQELLAQLESNDAEGDFGTQREPVRHLFRNKIQGRGVDEEAHQEQNGHARDMNAPPEHVRSKPGQQENSDQD